MKTGRNDPCPCGSGKKYKRCCALKQEQPPSGLKPAIRMKGGVAFDMYVNAYRAIVHSWDNPDCVGEPDEWQSEQAFQSEEEAMSFYKMNIRPQLELCMKEASRKMGFTVLTKRLE